MATQWTDLTTEEQKAVERMWNGTGQTLTTAICDRLIHLGLAEQKLGGVGLSKKGRDLYEAMAVQLVAARRMREGDQKKTPEEMIRRDLEGLRESFRLTVVEMTGGVPGYRPNRAGHLKYLRWCQSEMTDLQRQLDEIIRTAEAEADHATKDI